MVQCIGHDRGGLDEDWRGRELQRFRATSRQYPCSIQATWVEYRRVGEDGTVEDLRLVYGVARAEI